MHTFRKVSILFLLLLIPAMIFAFGSQEAQDAESQGATRPGVEQGTAQAEPAEPAAEPAAEPSGEVAAEEEMQAADDPNFRRLSELVGHEVANEAGDVNGNVDDAVLTTNGDITHLVVSLAADTGRGRPARRHRDAGGPDRGRPGHGRRHHRPARGPGRRTRRSGRGRRGRACQGPVPRAHRPLHLRRRRGRDHHAGLDERPGRLQQAGGGQAARRDRRRRSGRRHPAHPGRPATEGLQRAQCAGPGPGRDQRHHAGPAGQEGGLPRPGCRRIPRHRGEGVRRSHGSGHRPEPRGGEAAGEHHRGAAAPEPRHRRGQLAQPGRRWEASGSHGRKPPATTEGAGSTAQ